MRVGRKIEHHEDYWAERQDADKKLYLRIVEHLRAVGANTIISIARALKSNNCTVERVVDYHRRSFRTEIIDTRGQRRGTLVELNPCLQTEKRKTS
jgi:hypothetical protein